MFLREPEPQARPANPTEPPPNQPYLANRSRALKKVTRCEQWLCKQDNLTTARDRPHEILSANRGRSGHLLLVPAQTIVQNGLPPNDKIFTQFLVADLPPWRQNDGKAPASAPTNLNGIH